MYKRCFTFYAAIFIWLASIPTAETGEFIRSQKGMNEDFISCIAAHPVQRDELWVGTTKALYQSVDGGGHFEQRYVIPSGEQRIRSIYINPTTPDQMFLLNRTDVYLSEDRGLHWRHLDQRLGRFNQVYALSTWSGSVYLATDRGLFYRQKISDPWEMQDYHVAQEDIFDLIVLPPWLYLTTESQVIRVSLSAPYQGKVIKRISSFNSNRAESPPGDESEFTSPKKKINEMGYFFCSGIKQDALTYKIFTDRIYIVTENILYENFTDSLEWNHVFWGSPFLGQITDSLAWQARDSLKDDNARARQSLDSIYFLIGTHAGLFLNHQGKTIPLYQGLENHSIQCLALAQNGQIYVGTDNGLYRTPLAELLFKGRRLKQRMKSKDYERVEERYQREPDIHQVHAWAIEYADISPQKINQWKYLARQRAWLPSLNVGCDGDKNRTISDSLWGSYSGGGQHYLGPDDKTFYDNFSWDISLSWDLGDLVWSTDQTAIDSRSKLNTELREDILNQVTRLYFERRRIQLELYQEEIYEYYGEEEKGLRLAELSALLDAYTGGAFSRYINEVKRNE